MGFFLSVVSGVLIILQGTLRVVRGRWALSLGIGEFRRHSLGSSALIILGVDTIALGIVVFVGAYLILKGWEREGAITVIAFSVLSIFTGGGYYVGLILGVIGGAIVLSKLYPLKAPRKKILMDLSFLLG